MINELLSLERGGHMQCPFFLFEFCHSSHFPFSLFINFYSLWSHSCEWGQGDLCWEALPWKCSGVWGWVGWNFLACFELDLFSDQEISADSLLRSLRRFVQWHSEISNEFDQWTTRERTQDGRHYCDLVCEVLSCVYHICSLEGRQMVGSTFQSPDCTQEATPCYL